MVSSSYVFFVILGLLFFIIVLCLWTIIADRFCNPRTVRRTRCDYSMLLANAHVWCMGRSPNPDPS